MTDNISDIDSEIIQEFAQETRELIEQLEPSIIELGKTGDEQILNSIFRLFHSIKGGAGFMGFNHLSQLTHSAENLLDQIRSGKILLQQTDHIDLLCRTCDFLKEAMDNIEKNLNDNDMADQAKDLAFRFQQALEEAYETKIDSDVVSLKSEYKEPVENLQVTPSNVPEPDKKSKVSSEMIQLFVQEADELLQNIEQALLDWLKEPEDKDVINSLFRYIHSFKGNCGICACSDLEQLAHKMENVLEKGREGAMIGKSHPAKLLLQLGDVLHAAVQDIARGNKGHIKDLNSYLDMLDELLKKYSTLPDSENIPKRLGDMLIEQGELTNAEVELALENQSKPLGEVLIEKGFVSSQKVEKALNEQEKTAAKGKSKEKSTKSNKLPVKQQNIRVDLEKLDQLINIIGEMVIAENMLVRNPDLEGLELENFNKAAQQMNKFVKELQEMAMIIRMVPISGLFRRMIRLVHDLSLKFNKKVDLQVFGEDTELDKTVIETITDPLVHLIRNSLDHGIELPDERLKAGKPETGIVKLTASHEEGEVWITIEDDGRGLDREKILAKAISNGLIEGDGSDLNNKAVFGLVFLPGFSTAEKVTDVSGRGVGMDVVKKNIEKIQGKIEIQSNAGHGSKITLRIPLTLAIIDGMMVRVGDSRYILPITSMRETFCPEQSKITVSPDGQELVRVREEFFSVVRLHELYNKTPDHNELHKGILVVLETQESSFCLFVDEMLGQQQIVIKGLSSYIGNIRGVSGCTILGDGNVCLILDVNSLLAMANVAV